MFKKLFWKFNGETKKTFVHQFYSIDFPEYWKTTNENDIVSIFPEDDFGALTISVFKGINWNQNKIAEFIINISNNNPNAKMITIFTQNNITEFKNSYIEDNKNWTTKLFKKDDKLYLLTINCDIIKWENNKELFYNSVNSFKINNF